MRRVALLLLPFLVAAYPVLFLFAHNADQQVTFSPLWLPLTVTMAAVAGAFMLVRAVVHDLGRAALTASLLAVLVLGWGYVSSIARPVVANELWLLPVWALAGGTGIVLVLRTDVARYRFAVALAALAAGGVVWNAGLAATKLIEWETIPRPTVTAAGAHPVARPDIYYIIVDRYASAGALKRYYGFDNRPFLEALAARGFYVGSESRANYLRTPLSLVSSLSMAYLDGEALQTEAAAGGRSPTHRRLRGHLAVPTFLKDLGYRYFHIPTLWEPSAENVLADVVLRSGGPSQFASALLEMTLLGVVTPDATPTDQWTGPNIRRQTLFQLDQLGALAGAPGPKYVFAHLLLPHPPYVFDVDGTYPTQEELSARGNDESYVRQVQYTNRRLLELVDRLLAGDDDPVIIIQADEGPWPDRFRAEDADFQWLEATPDELEEKLGILNAYHLPGKDARAVGLYPSITPVNSFRVIFNAYFGADLPLVPDRFFIHPDGHRFYELIDITQRLRGRPAA